jgi:hypothetical protein
LERLALPASLNLLASHFGKKRAPPALADQPVYAGHDILGQGNAGSLGRHLCHTNSVTRIRIRAAQTVFLRLLVNALSRSTTRIS